MVNIKAMENMNINSKDDLKELFADIKETISTYTEMKLDCKTKVKVSRNSGNIKILLRHWPDNPYDTWEIFNIAPFDTEIAVALNSFNKFDLFFFNNLAKLRVLYYLFSIQ